jgi:outer membrane protein assembly factor BamB
MNRRLATVCLFAPLLCLAASADDWTRFRGPAGSGVSADSKIPLTWSSAANLDWKTALPGPGASSPIIVGDRVLVTCYSGYGLDRNDPGQLENLVRHLVCIQLSTGKKLWQKDVKVVLPEDPFTGIGVTAHGYASHTPVTDGKNVYAFFGKSGVHAFSLAGKKLWEINVGKESDPAKWGSSSSPIIYKNTVIVTASAESQSIVGIDRETGQELWRQEAKGLDGMWGTPALVQVNKSRTDLVMCVAREIWGLNPDNGDLRWFAKATNAAQSYASVVLDGSRAFAVTGRGGGSVAIDVGGQGDVTESNTIWEGSETASFASPVLHKSRIYVVASKILKVIDASNGKVIKQFRLKGSRSGGRMQAADYPSPVVAGDHLYYLDGSGQMYVFDIRDQPKQVAMNRITMDSETFWGTPAIKDGKLLMRSSKFLYCVKDKGQKAETSPELLSKADNRPATLPAGGGRGGNRFDPAAMFNGMDPNRDGKVTFDELEGNRMADRLKTLDKDGDQAISRNEFTSGISSLFGRPGGSRSGGSRSGGSRSRGGNDGQGGGKRPDRPQRPQLEKTDQ